MGERMLQSFLHAASARETDPRLLTQRLEGGVVRERVRVGHASCILHAAREKQAALLSRPTCHKRRPGEVRPKQQRNIIFSEMKCLNIESETPIVSVSFVYCTVLQPQTTKIQKYRKCPIFSWWRRNTEHPPIHVLRLDHHDSWMIVDDGLLID